MSANMNFPTVSAGGSRSGSYEPGTAAVPTPVAVSGCGGARVVVPGADSPQFSGATFSITSGGAR